jgi:hypothetical protein
MATRSLTGSGAGNIPILYWQKFSIRKYTNIEHLRKQWKSLVMFRLPSVVLQRTRLTFQTIYNEATQAFLNVTFNANIAQPILKTP